MARIFIGVAWPYANGQIHIGGVAGCYLPPDIFARYNRMKGNQVLMVSGSDMHGTPVTVLADKEGVSPKEIAERYHQLNSKALEELGISFDVFLSTEAEIHKEVVKDLFNKLHKNGHIYEKDMILPYCPDCSKYLPDRYVEGECPYCGYEDARGDQCDECGKLLEPEQLKNSRCKVCGQSPEPVKRTHLFFKLSAFEDRLKEYLKDKNYWKPHVINFTRNWLENGLTDRPISRDIDWGIDIPLEGYEDKKIYVWFEAFMGYLTMAHAWARQQGDPEKWRDFWQDENTRHYYFLGKDNVPFHTIFWPAVIMAVEDDLNLPYDVPANAFMRFGGEQFSKSRGVSVNLKDLVEQYDPDALRYYISIIMPENRDADFSWKEFVEKNNNELVATYGNFVHRALSFTHKNFEEIPMPGSLDIPDKEAVEKIETCARDVGDLIEKCEFKRAIKRAMELARFGNQYFDFQAPWSQIKQDKEKCATTLFTSLYIARGLSIIMAPFLPFSSQKLWEMLGEDGSVDDMKWEDALVKPRSGTKLLPPIPLFKKLEMIDMVESEAGEFPDDMKKLDLRIGEISEVYDHPNADKLIIMKVKLGDEERQLVAGLKEYYAPEELKGLKIVVLCNLQPAKLRGIESQGMLLAAEMDDKVSILIPEGEASPGERILGTTTSAQISFPEFQKFILEIGSDMIAEFVSQDGKRTPLKTENSRIVPDKEMSSGARIR